MRQLPLRLLHLVTQVLLLLLPPLVESVPLPLLLLPPLAKMTTREALLLLLLL